MNKTLYVKDSEVHIWEKAEKLASDGVSPLVTSLLADWVKRNEPPTENGFERIEIETQISDEAPTIKKAFMGRWLIHPSEQFRAEPTTGVQWDCTDTTYAVAKTKRGAFAIYVVDENRGFATLTVHDTFEEFRDAEEGGYQAWPDNLIAGVAEALGQPYVVDLDI